MARGVTYLIAIQEVADAADGGQLPEAVR